MNAYAVNLAVVAGHGNLETQRFELNYGLLHGTAFCLAPSLFLTAGHVYQDAKEDGQVALARLTPVQQQVVTVQDAEVFENIDLALLLCPNLSAEILPFHFSPLEYLTDVFPIGYPFGLEPPMYHMRAFKGYVVTRRGLKTLTGNPPGYEISFVPPPGMSGAPLLISIDSSPKIVGMILQHHTAEYRERRMDLGLALDIEEILTLESRITGGSIAELLFRRPRIVRRK
jgi:hypothetical protein